MRSSWHLIVPLHTLSTEFDALMDMMDEGGAEAVFLDEAFCESEVVVPEVEEDAIGALGVDFYFDDGCVGGGVPMRGPRALLLD